MLTINTHFTLANKNKNAFYYKRINQRTNNMKSLTATILIASYSDTKQPLITAELKTNATSPVNGFDFQTSNFDIHIEYADEEAKKLYSAYKVEKIDAKLANLSNPFNEKKNPYPVIDITLSADGWGAHIVELNCIGATIQMRDFYWNYIASIGKKDKMFFKIDNTVLHFVNHQEFLLPNSNFSRSLSNDDNSTRNHAKDYPVKKFANNTTMLNLAFLPSYWDYDTTVPPFEKVKPLLLKMWEFAKNEFNVAKTKLPHVFTKERLSTAITENLEEFATRPNFMPERRNLMSMLEYFVKKYENYIPIAENIEWQPQALLFSQLTYLFKVYGENPPKI